MSTESPCSSCGGFLADTGSLKGHCPRCLFGLGLEASDSPTEITQIRPEGSEAWLSPGQLLGNRYEIRSLLGRGGMGEVWRAFDVKLQVEVALKSLRRELFQSERALEALRQEVRAAREVVSHHVCRVFDLVEMDGDELVSMEHIDGQTLLEYLQEKGRLELREASEKASQFLAGMEAIHQAGFVHRDIKPENLMMTRSGRVVVMDFGIAKPALMDTGTVSGTPAYMAPEQARGERVDARADVFSAGVVLAEMIAAQGIKDRNTRQSVWRGVHQEPPELPDTPWLPVLQKAVARDPGERYGSASALARALEEITLRVEGAEDLRPYPGLASFTEAEAEYFFGRELEVEAMWRKLHRPHLQGLIGPSGAGKSSFLKAGVIPAMPEGWSFLVLTPGSTPFIALGQALAPKLSGDTEAMQQLLHFSEPDVAVTLISRWRNRHDEALLIIDQFEELFTLNPPEVQSQFAELLGRLALEADVRVLLSMRDDFLLHCQAHEALRPMFSELTPLVHPSGSALRRALMQPALKCGYRFAEEELAEEMLREVEDERGALPLLAFAVASLWERRDREKGLLIREAYEVIGGVGGALAQHAEATLEKIGSTRIPIVREIFRNLVTAQGTRAVREMEELLSVFEDREVAREVMSTLIDARLLTSFEVSGSEGDEKSHHRVEIIHESLLSAWPRLVRWQTQDVDGAQLRDQLRQAAQMWKERNRSEELLWTGTPFQEFQLWRERYPGGLSELEESYAHAMVIKSERKKRRRRFAMTAVIVVLLSIIGVIGSLWRQSEEARRLGEAARLLALGQLELNEYPTGAVAYSIASLELADTPEARRFALEALWRGPTETILKPLEPQEFMQWAVFSPDGEWLAFSGFPGNGQLWSADGQTYRLFGGHGSEPENPKVRFVDGGGTLLSGGGGTIRFWSVPEARELRRLEFEQSTMFEPVGSRLFTFARVERGRIKGEDQIKMESRPLEGGEPTVLGGFEARVWWVDPTGRWLAYTTDKEIYAVSLEEASAWQPRLVGRHREPIRWFTWTYDGKRIASVSEAGAIRIWSLASDSTEPMRILEENEAKKSLAGEGGGGRRRHRLAFNHDGSLLAARGSDNTARVWDLAGPPDSEPIVLQRYHAPQTLAFHPNGQWLATAGKGTVAFSPLDWRYPYVLRGESENSGLTFTSDGRWLVTAGLGELRLWPLSMEAGSESRVLLDEGLWYFPAVRVDPSRRSLLVSGASGRLWLVPLDEGQAMEIATGFATELQTVALGPQGRLAATSIFDGPKEEKSIRVVNLDTGDVQVLGPPEGAGEGIEGATFGLEFLPDGRLLSSGTYGLYLWNLEDGSAEVLEKGSWWQPVMALSPDGRYAFVAVDRKLNRYDLEENTFQTLDSHGSGVRMVACDPTGHFVVTGDFDGVVRAGPITGEEPHLFLGHKEGVEGAVAVSPDGRWLASSGNDGTTRIWPMPEKDEIPFHMLPYEELLDRLRSLTNLRAVPDESSFTGYKLEPGPFPGWKNVPTW